ncbi:MAG: hypothetical protein JWO45_1498, partial [Spartobacteria bacterium]|nr:hypothetical protein [Spartobacteria bacterium]
QVTHYKPVRPFSMPGSDLMIWQEKGTLPSFAPIYNKKDELSQGLVVIGRGTQRGDEVILNGTSRGWTWGPGDGVWRWGQNDVSQIVPYHGHDLLYSTFDQHVVLNDRPNESHLSTGDSGGAVFLNDSGTWKLAGINFAVDDLYTTASKDSLFLGAIFDARGYYSSDGNDPPTFTQITGTAPVPTGFYASRIASELAWIGSALADPQVGRNGNSLTFTYTKLVVPPTALTYTIEESKDLISWSTSATQGDVISDTGEFQTIKAELNPGMPPRLFARLRVTLPP